MPTDSDSVELPQKLHKLSVLFSYGFRAVSVWFLYGFLTQPPARFLCGFAWNL